MAENRILISGPWGRALPGATSNGPSTSEFDPLESVGGQRIEPCDVPWVIHDGPSLVSQTIGGIPQETYRLSGPKRRPSAQHCVNVWEWRGDAGNLIRRGRSSYKTPHLLLMFYPLWYPTARVPSNHGRLYSVFLYVRTKPTLVYPSITHPSHDIGYLRFWCSFLSMYVATFPLPRHRHAECYDSRLDKPALQHDSSAW